MCLISVCGAYVCMHVDVCVHDCVCACICVDGCMYVPVDWYTYIWVWFSCYIKLSFMPAVSHTFLGFISFVFHV